LNAIVHVASTRALQLEDVSLITPLLIFSPVFTVLIAAIFLGEIPSTRGMMGILLVLLGAYWLNHAPGSDWFELFRSLAFKPAMGLVLLAGFLWAITPLFEKTAILHTVPASPRFTAFIANVLLFLSLTPTVITRGRSSIERLFRHRREFLLAGLISGMAPLLGYTAFSLGYVGYVTTLFKMSMLLTMIWSFLILKERGWKLRLSSSIVMIIGAILIAT